jgi:hypothetical protein
MLFKEIIAVYTENYMKPITQNEALPIVKLDGIYSYYSALNG